MSKYNSNAGFKNYDVDEEISSENVATPFSKIKSGLVIGGIALGIIVVIIILLAIFARNESPSENTEAEETKPATTEKLDYYELFGVETTSEEEEITIDNPYTIAPTTQPITTAPVTSPTVPTTTKPAPTPKPSTNNQSSKSSSQNNGSTSGGSGNNQKSTNNSSGNSGAGNQSSTSQNKTQSSAPKINTSSKTPTTIAVKSVSISKSSISIFKGSSKTLSAGVSPSNATNKSITWSSGDNSIATVSNGKIHAVGVGSTKIYASSNNGVKAECSVVVKERAVSDDSITIEPAEKSILLGRYVTIELKGARTCTWSFSNPFVLSQASVNGTKIKVKGVKKGMSNVEATLPNGKKYKCKITVK